MNGQQAPDETPIEVEVAVEDQPLLEERPPVGLSPATVGPCPACRRIVARALGERPDFPIWFHLGPRAGLCLRHREGAKVSE